MTLSNFLYPDSPLQRTSLLPVHSRCSPRSILRPEAYWEGGRTWTYKMHCCRWMKTFATFVYEKFWDGGLFLLPLAHFTQHHRPISFRYRQTCVALPPSHSTVGFTFCLAGQDPQWATQRQKAVPDAGRNRNFGNMLGWKWLHETALRTLPQKRSRRRRPQTEERQKQVPLKRARNA